MELKTKLMVELQAEQVTELQTQLTAELYAEQVTELQAGQLTELTAELMAACMTELKPEGLTEVMAVLVVSNRSGAGEKQSLNCEVTSAKAVLVISFTVEVGNPQ